MANANRPAGLRPYGDIIQESPYTAGAAIYPGDLVHMEDDGKVDPAVASEAVLGVAASYASADGQEVLVWDHPDQKFIVQADDGTTLAQTAVGLNYNVIATAGNTTYKRSRMELDSDSGATNSNLPLKLLAFDREVNNVAGEFAECIVSINMHQLAKGAGVEGL
jgi:hypothetical protein